MFGYSLLFFFLLITFLFDYFNNFLKFIIIFLAFFLPSLPSRGADRNLVLWPGVRPELLRSET